MVNEHINTKHGMEGHFCCVKRLSWTAIIVGALVGVGLSFLLDVFGLAIGLSAFNASQGAQTMAVGGFIGMIIGGIASMYVAGWVAGYLGSAHGVTNRNIGSLYGFTAWCLALILAVLLAAPATNFISDRDRSLSNPRSALVRVSNNVASPVVSQQANMQDTSVTATPASDKALGASLFVMFITFFIGALASSFGGYHGYKPRNEMYEKV